MLGSNILIFGDGESALIQKRVGILMALPQNKILIHNATGRKLADESKEYFHGFHIIEQPPIKSRALRYAASCFLTLFYILKFRPKLIVVHWASRLYQNIIFRFFAYKIIVTVMGGEIMPDQEGKHPKKRFYTKMLIDNARFMTTESSYMKGLIINDFNGKEERIIVCNFGVEESFYNPAVDYRLYEKLDIQKGAKVFFSMRAMEPFYQIHEIVNSFIEFKRLSGSDAILIATANRSSPEYLSLIEDIVKTSVFVESIKIVRNIKHEDMAKYIAISDAVISMAPSDGLPHTMLECLAAKKFMIFRNLPQYKGFLEHKKNAFLADDKQRLLEAFLFVQNSDELNYEPSNEALALIDKKLLTRKYLAACQEIISQNSGVF